MTERLTLPNGTELWAHFEWTDSNGVVLAYNHHNDEWITWEYYRGDLKSTSQGHYYDNAREAELDFFKRANRMGGVQ